MRGHNLGFYLEIRYIVSDLSVSPVLIWYSAPMIFLEILNKMQRSNEVKGCNVQEKQLSAKASLIFSTKNISVFVYKVVKHLTVDLLTSSLSY